MTTTRNRLSLALLLIAAVLPLAGVAHAQSPSYNLDSGTVRQTWGVGGSTGPTLVNNSGVIEVHAPGGALGIARVTTPVGSTDIANKNYVDTHVSGGSPTGTGIAYVTSNAFASDAVTTTTDLSLGTLSGTSLPATVVGWQGRSVASTAPSTGNVYRWSGSNWTPGLLTLAGLTPGAANQMMISVGGVPTWQTISGSCTNVSGVFTCSGGGATTQTGVGLWYNATSGTLNGSAIALGGDLTPGSFSSPTLSMTVSGAMGHALPSFGTGVLGVAGGAWTMSPVLPVGNVSPGSSNQFLVTVGGTPTWETMSGNCTNVAGVLTCSGGGGGATSISGDANGSISGSNIPVTNTAIQGFAWAASTPSSAQIPIYQSSTWTPTTVSGNGTLSSTGVLGVSNFTLPGQTAGGLPYYTGSAWDGTGAGTSGQCLQSGGAGAPTWGSCGGGGGITALTGDVVASGSGAVATLVEAISGTGSTASVPFNAATLAWSTGNTALSETSGVSSLKMGAYTAISADSSILVFGNGVTTQPVSFRANSAEWGQYLGSGSNRGWQLGYNGAGPDFGGGDEVLGISRAVTEPTSLPSTAGDVAIYGWNSSGSWLGLAASGIRPDGPAIGAGGSFTFAPSTVPSGTGINLIFQAGGTSSGTAGGLAAESHNESSVLLLNDTSATLDSNGSLTFDATSSGNVPICLGCANTTGATSIGNGNSTLVSLTSGTAIHLDAATAVNVPIAIAAAHSTGSVTIGNTGSSGIAIVSGGIGVSINTSGSGATTAIGSTSAGSTTIESTNSSFSVSGASLTGEATGGFTLDSPGSANSPFCFGCLFSTGSIALGNANTSSYTSTTVGLNLLQGATVEATNAAGSTPYFTYTSSQGTSNVPLQSTPSIGSLVEHSAAPQGTVNSQAQLVNSLLWGFGETVNSATPKTLYTYTIPTGKGAYGIASVSCRATTAAGIVSVGDSWGASYNFQCQNPSGSANCNSTIIGSAQSASSMSGTMASVAASGATYVVSVTNLATVTVDCTAAITNGIVN